MLLLFFCCFFFHFFFLFSFINSRVNRTLTESNTNISHSFTMRTKQTHFSAHSHVIKNNNKWEHFPIRCMLCFYFGYCCCWFLCCLSIKIHTSLFFLAEVYCCDNKVSNVLFMAFRINSSICLIFFIFVLLLKKRVVKTIFGTYER